MQFAGLYSGFFLLGGAKSLYLNARVTEVHANGFRQVRYAPLIMLDEKL
jgi:hypothetical protein